jgi:hypothetical protein
MSFLRHEEIYRSDVRPGYSWSGNPWSPPQRSSAAMSFQSAIPWRVALRQSPPPLHRLATILNNPLRRTMIFQRTATTPLTSCLSPRVHSTSYSPHSPRLSARLGAFLSQAPFRVCSNPASTQGKRVARRVFRSSDKMSAKEPISPTRAQGWDPISSILSKSDTALSSILVLGTVRRL